MDPSRLDRRSHLRALLGLLAVPAIASVGSIAGCGRRPPRVPTRPGPRATGAGGDPTSELLDTDDGPIAIDRLDPQQGPRDAHAVVVIFSDFQCPFCRDIAAVMAKIRAESPKDVRLVFKHLPTPMHFHSRAASVAAQVVFLEAGTDAFWRFHDRAFAHQSDIDQGVLFAWARDEGVRAEAITERGPEAERRVTDDITLAERLGIHGTPHLYVNARSIAGAYPYEQMRGWIDEVL